MTLRRLSAVQPFRDNLGAENSINVGPHKGTWVVPTGRKYAGTVVAMD